MGLIGRNGAGKTTTIKSILNLIHSSGGEIEYFGKKLNEHEAEIKQQIGYAGGAVDYYKKKKIKKSSPSPRASIPDGTTKLIANIWISLSSTRCRAAEKTTIFSIPCCCRSAKPTP